MFELQDKMILKAYLSAKLYYNLGAYFGNCTSGGNNYEASSSRQRMHSTTTPTPTCARSLPSS